MNAPMNFVKPSPQARPAQSTLAPLKNVAACLALMDKLLNRGPNRPPIGVFHGFTGYGKTMAATYTQNKTRAVRVEVGESWTRKKLMQNILAECSVDARGTVADMVDTAIEYLAEENRPLIIDEADKLVDKGFIENIREIADKAKCPVMLIGEEKLPTKLAAVERVHGRVLDWVAAQPCDMEDARVLADLYCDVGIADDLLEDIVRAARGRPRLVVVSFDRIADFARNNGLAAVDRATYEGGFFTGVAPRARSE